MLLTEASRLDMLPRIKRALRITILAVGYALAAAAPLAAGETDVAFFEAKVRPLLEQRCLECHGAKKQKGGLRLDSKSGWTTGGDRGPAVEPGKPEASLLVNAVRYADDDLQMPPSGKLAAGEIAVFEQWVARGAPDPRVGSAAVPVKQSWPDVFRGRKQWWSLQSVRPVEPPVVDDPAWSHGGVDRFLRARMQRAGVEPAGVAGPRTLIRRASLVLTGLPPSPDEVSAFVAASQADPQGAYEALVERLLAWPHFGERFARHWLDVVRFTETSGNEWNYDVPFAWRYRDYVIRAFNGDVPYDQFVREHIAGDLLPQPRWNGAERFNESVIGTAFYRFGEVNHDSCVTFGVIGYDIADNQVDTLSKAFQATTVACARCHDHKLDAISANDYHALLGIVRSSRSVQHTLDAPEVNRDALAKLRELKPALRSELASVWSNQARMIDAAALTKLLKKGKTPPAGEPLHAWSSIHETGKPTKRGTADVWAEVATRQAKESAEAVKFNAEHFTPYADFRRGTLAGWTPDGMGLRGGAGASGDFVVAHEGDAAVKALLPAGAYSFALSDKLNGALRSPTLKRSHAKLSFEVVGGRSSLVRLVFNNCQLNYNHQRALHHPDWTWVTIDLPENTEPLHPYAELLTFWDSPKYPDPIATLGKDTANQRHPWSEHAKNPRTWWGIRRVVLHDGAETPQDESTWVSRLFAGAAPTTEAEAAARYVQVAADAVEAFAHNRATDDDVRWLDWLLKTGLLSNKAAASPRLADLTAQYRELELHRLALPRTMPGLADEGDGFAQPLLARGDYTKPGAAVPHRYLEVLSSSPGAAFTGHGSGRRELAELVASANNPLTARVMVNRVWQWVFGNGLVRTPDDFGHVGELPSHPELLDRLAADFVAEGWSVKQLVRTLVTSRAFQSASAPVSVAREQDPQNLLLSHFAARRAEAEVIRDCLLAVSGRLDGRLYGPSVHPYREQEDSTKRLFVGPLDGDGRRSIYLKVQLMEAPRFLSAFNLPGGKVTQGRRDATNVPAQSLALLNDPFVLAMAQAWAERLVRDGSTDIAPRVDAMFLAALGRQPTQAESERLAAAVRSFARLHDVAQGDTLSSQAVWQDAAHLMFNFKEFIFIP
jgi:cytochrome c553